MNYTQGDKESTYTPTAVEPCGCHVREEPLWSAQIIYCPKHKAALDMYEALSCILHGDFNRGQALGVYALIKAEGK